ncbi:MAG: 50S ribosomal protein L13 [Gammaproteobacteria bacterium]|nr:50S ribosomal protein L13 [Gammaproteobacteria bacterium]
MKTYVAKKNNIQHNWIVVDAETQVLGRLASKIALILRGKHKPEFTPNADTGDYVIVINAEKIRVTGRKFMDKMYTHHSGYPGGIKTISFRDLLAKFPERIIRQAVCGMLPKNPLGRAMAKKLKIYAGPSHQHTAQQPKTLSL